MDFEVFVEEMGVMGEDLAMDALDGVVARLLVDFITGRVDSIAVPRASFSSFYSEPPYLLRPYSGL